MKEISPPRATFHLPAEGRRASIILPCSFHHHHLLSRHSFFLVFFPLFFLPHTLQLSHCSLLPNLNSLPHTSNSLCLPLYPLFISEKASAISWHDTVCHQHCLPSAFDRGISTPLPFPSLFFFVFALLYFCPPPPHPHVSCHLLPIVSLVFSGGEIRQL